MGTTYELIQKPGFLHDLVALSKDMQKKVIAAVETVQREPFGPKSKQVLKHLYRNLYRIRVREHRMLFAVGTGCVSILAIGPRSNIYDRFRPKAVETPDIANPTSAEPQPIPTAPGDAIPAELPTGGDDSAPEDSPPAVDQSTLLRELLTTWGIPPEFHDRVLACRTADELIGTIPEQHIEAILHWNAPPPVAELVQQPSLELPRPSDLAEFLDGTLSGFLLRLDEEQAKVAARQLKGPTMVKGGPGTGKSLVALYRIRSLMQPPAQHELFAGTPPRVLFLTYTKALTRASEQLLARLVGIDLRRQVDVRTVDSLAARLVGNKESRRATGRKLDDALRRARKEVKFSGGVLEQAAAQKVVAGLQDCYLLEEFEWVIDGRGLDSVEAYLETSRSGRGTRFDARTRRAVWELYITWARSVRADAGVTYTQIQGMALERARTLSDADKFDVVVIDEAQDLKPVGIRLAVAMARGPEGLYLTADEAQSIYGRGYSWKQVADELDFRGRTTILKRNYRLTKPIQQAAAQFCDVSGIADPDGKAEAMREGPLPLALEHGGAPGDAIARYFKQWAEELRMPVWSSAVLVRSRAFGENIVEQLERAGIAAAWVGSGDLELDAHHVKVMTMHAAKGLEFPMVCVAGLKDGVIPTCVRRAQDADDRAEFERQERMLLHVAMTRAMRRLMITFPGNKPSPFVADLDASLWEQAQWR